MTFDSETKSLLSFHFKGDRKYVQGPDIFNKVNEILLDQHKLSLRSLKFVMPLMSNAYLHIIQDSGELDDDCYSAKGVAVDKMGNNVSFVVIPRDNSLISKSESYEESLITNYADLCDEFSRIELYEPTKFSLIEESVALIKYHHNLCMPYDKKKWLYTAIQVHTPALFPYSRDGQDLMIIPKKIIAKRFSKNDVYLNNILLATIDFTLGIF